MARLTDRALDFVRAVLNRPAQERADATQPIGSQIKKDSAHPSLFGLMGERGIEETVRVDQDLVPRMVDYEHMDQYPELSSAADIYADDATQPDTVSGRTVTVDSDDHEIKDALEDCFFNRLDIDSHIWEIARSLVKYGNEYEELLVTDRGVIGLEFMSAPSMRRMETREVGLAGFIQDPSGQFSISPEQVAKVAQHASPEQLEEIQKQLGQNTVIYENWQVVHMRLRSVYRSARYGFSVFEPARWIWKRLVLLEDSMMVYKLSRAPSRYAFYVDVGTKAPRAAIAYLNEVKKQFKKKKFVNEKTGQLDLRFNPLGMDEDFFIPIINGQDAARIEVLAGPNYQATEDVEYFLRKLYAAIKVPKMYLGFSEDRSANSILSNVDVQFARTVLRVQRELKNGLRKIARVHLAALGLDPSYAFFDVNFTIPSGVYEIAQMEIRNAKADLASRMREFVSNEWVLKEIFGFTDEEVQSVKEQRAAEEGGGAGGPGAPGALPGAEGGEGGAPNPFGGGEGGENFGGELRGEAKEFAKHTRRDLRELRKKASELLQEDRGLRHQLQEVGHLLRELRVMKSTTLRNGNGQPLNGGAKRFTLDTPNLGL